MKKLSAIIFVFIFTIFIQAQSANTNNLVQTDDKPKTDANAAPNANSGGKFNLPPEKMRPVNVVKFAAPPAIDGKLDDEVWKSAQVLKDFYQTSPGNNIAASKPTEVMVGYDEKNLYIAFRCFDEKDKIRATVAKRDEVFGEDNVRIWLDTYNDQRRAYILGFNPYGIQQDGIFTEGDGADFSVDIVMESKGVIEDWGWSVEVQIPFKSLRYTAGKGKLWGFNAARHIDRFNNEFDQWLPDDRDISGFLVKHGKLAGLNEIKYERTLEIVPSITLSETGSRKRTLPISTANSSGFDPIFNPAGVRDFGRFVNDSITPELGVNLKYTLSPNITLDAAINPDFAEIEADAPVVSANQRFPIFFEEKRPFFLEGKEIFDSPLSPFYSRTIIDPDVAAKLTGKVGANSFGLLLASDNAPGNYSLDERNDPFISRRIGEFVDKNAYFGVVRLKHDIGSQNNV
ncbi:MAG: carbohydrate binding family 9 domain-containing protein [Pyrinomonadaceae bacterium]|nr:carbohydrate binding family 9 domain-containing protein [Pyrinomonadaceae bacterium]